MSFTDKAKSRAQELAGAAKERIGDATDNERLRAEGAGRVREADDLVGIVRAQAAEHAMDELPGLGQGRAGHGGRGVEDEHDLARLDLARLDRGRGGRRLRQQEERALVAVAVGGTSSERVIRVASAVVTRPLPFTSPH